MSTLKITEQKTVLKVQVTDTGVKIVKEEPANLKIQENKTLLKVIPHKPILKINEQLNKILKVQGGIQGPKGEKGDAGTVIEAIAGEDISALKIVRAINATDVILSNSNSTFENAKCVGMSLTGATAGNLVRIQFFGAVGDASFNFPVNAPLFLTTDGQITDDDTVLTVYNTTIGYSLGAGAIFIDLQEPIEL